MARYALVIGISRYDNFRNLDKAATDAAAIARILQTHGQYQVEPLPKRLIEAENRWELATDKKLTGKALEQSLETFLLERAKDQEALIYFAGHGFEVPGLGRRKKGYLATSDCTSDGRNAILFSDLNDLIRESSLSNLVLILDCCHAGSFLERTMLESTLTAFKEKKDYYLITACRSFERAREGEEHGIFTAAVLKGLQPDNADTEGTVTGDRLFDFVQRELRQSGQEPIRTGTGRSITLVSYQPQAKTVSAIMDEHGEIVCPYQGLQAFTAAQRKFFFGRKLIVEAIKQKLEQQPFVPVIGASGSGKSSVVRAGLIPWLEESGWRILEPIKPGFEPLVTLRGVFEPFFKRSRLEIQTLHQLIFNDPTGLFGVIERFPGNNRYLLAVDQFEEVFTVCVNEVERQRFIELISQVAEMQNFRLAVVTTVRADFLDSCLHYPSLHQLIQSQAIFMPPLNGIDLRDAITEPAKLQGYTVEDKLLLQILDDVGKEPGFLPLLEFALTKLWEKRDQEKHLLTLEQYQKLGGLTGTLNFHAERVYHYRDYEAEFPSNQRNKQEQEWIKRIFLKLVRTGEGEKDTRRRQLKANLVATIAGNDLQNQEVLRELLDGEGGLVQGRLLVAGEDAQEASWVDLAHEALISGWQTFVKWRNENPDLRRLVERVEDALQDWLKEQQDENLLVGGLLVQVQSQWNELENNLSHHAREFCDQSIKLKQLREEQDLKASNFVGTLVGSLDGVIKEANNQFLQIVGYSRADLTTEKISWRNITPEEYIDLDQYRLDEAKARGACTPYEKEFIRKDGSRAAVKVGFSFRKETNDIFALVLDLTERKQLERMLRKILAQAEQDRQRTEAAISNLNKDLQNRVDELQTLFEVIPIGILIATDPEFKELRANPAFAKIMGITAGHNASSTPPSGEVHPSYKTFSDGKELEPEEMPLRYAVIHGVAIEGTELDILRGDSTLFNLYSYASPLFDQQGKPRGAVGAFLDITDRKRAEAEREQLLNRERLAREQAETANRLKDEFLAMLSHELRTPLNAILGWSRILQSRQFDEQMIKRAAQTIERNATSQSQLIEDLLDMSSVLVGKLRLNVSQVKLIPAIEAAIETVRLAAEAKKIQLQVVFISDVGLVLGDSNRLQQVILNLLSNAVKFTQEGGQVEVSLEEVNNYAQIQVRDDGRGISPDFLPYVFDYFRQADSSTTRSVGGLGLGLAIVRQIVELHGGTVTAESLGEGHGATFTIKLPLMTMAQNPSQAIGLVPLEEEIEEKASITDELEIEQEEVPLGKEVEEKTPTTDELETEQEELLASTEDLITQKHQNSDNTDYQNSNFLKSEGLLSLANIKVLLIEDDNDSREVLTFIIEQFGAQVAKAASVKEALNVLKEFKPDVLISDISMPGTDGYTLIKQVRALTIEQGRQIPAIALTAYTRQTDREYALSVGFQIHLSKPVNEENLVTAIAELVELAK